VSIQAVGWVLQHSRAKGVTRLVLISLANHANDQSMCWPSQRTIAREAGIGKGTVSLAIDRLLEMGELTIVLKGGSHSSTRYRLGYPQPENFAHQVGEAGPEMGAAPTPGPRAAPTPGVGRTINNRHEPNSVQQMNKEGHPARAMSAGIPRPVDRCETCGRLEIDCECG
jgi:Helix-turn-helix domain